MQKLVATSLASLMFAGTLINPTVRGAIEDHDTDQAPGRHLPGEYLVRSLLRYLSEGSQPPGEPRFKAKPGTPAVNGYTDALLYNNPNS